MLRVQLCCVAAAAMLVIGCTSSGSSRVSYGSDTLQSQQKVLESVAQLEVKPLQPADTAYFTIDEQSEILVEGDKRHFALLLALPPMATSFSVKLSSIQFGPPHDPAILYPELRTLNSKRETVRVLPHDMFVYRTSVGRNSLEGVVFVNEPFMDERFVLVRNREVDSKDLTEAGTNVTTFTSAAVPVPGGAAFWMIPTGVNLPPKKLLASPTGEIEVLVEAYRLRKVQ